MQFKVKNIFPSCCRAKKKKDCVTLIAILGFLAAAALPKTGINHID
jgi:hypothetical protein